jgi:cell division initiation protein
MMTPQDIREKTFEKAVFGGYDMGAVDEFLEQLCTELTAQQKETATLRAKMKVLVEKIEEYRSNEDALKTALLSAQKFGDQIESEAKAKGDKIVADAEVKAAQLSRDAQLELANDEARLVEAKRVSAAFLENMRLLCTKQLDFLDHLNELQFVKDLSKTDAGADDETLKTIADNGAKAAADTDDADAATKPFTPLGRDFSL